MKESNNQVMVPSVSTTNGSSSSKIEKARNLFRVLKNPPQPHMCIQDFLVKSCSPCFINVLSWSKLSTPSNPLDPIPLYGGMKVINHSTNALKLTISNYSQDSEILQHPDVFAVMAHPDVLRVSGKKCSDIKDRDAFIDLMLDFIEAMNPGIKFQRKFVVLGDRDLAGELKDIWHTVHNKRQKEKMNHSSHGEGDTNYCESKHNSNDTTVRISKQTTKNMAELSVKELCSAVDVAVTEPSTPSNKKPKSWLFHKLDSCSSDSNPCYRHGDHEEKAEGVNNNARRVNFPLQSVLPITLSTSISNSSSENIPTFSVSEKKAFRGDLPVDQSFKPLLSSELVCTEPLQQVLPHINVLQDAISLHRSSEMVVPFLEDRSHFELSSNKFKTNESQRTYCDDVTKRGKNGKYKQSVESNQLSSQSVTMMCEDLPYQELPLVIQTNQSAITFPVCDDVGQSVVTYQQHPLVSLSNQPVMTMFEDIVLADASYDQRPIVPLTKQPIVAMFENVIHTNVAYDQHPLTSLNQPAIPVFENVHSDVTYEQHPVVPPLSQPAVTMFEDVLLSDIQYEQCPVVSLASQTVTMFKDGVHPDVTYEQCSIVPVGSQAAVFEDAVHNSVAFEHMAVTADDVVQESKVCGQYACSPECNQPFMVVCGNGGEMYKEAQASTHKTSRGLKKEQNTVIGSCTATPATISGLSMQQSSEECFADLPKKNDDSLEHVESSQFVSEKQVSDGLEKGFSRNNEKCNENCNCPFLVPSANVDDINTVEFNTLCKEKYTSLPNSPLCSDGKVNCNLGSKESESSVYRLSTINNMSTHVFINKPDVQNHLVTMPIALESMALDNSEKSVIEIISSDKLSEIKISKPSCLDQGSEVNVPVAVNSQLLPDPCSNVAVVNDPAADTKVGNGEHVIQHAKISSQTTQILKVENKTTVNRLLDDIKKSDQVCCNDSFTFSQHKTKQKISKDNVSTGNVPSPTELPLINTSCSKSGRKNTSGNSSRCMKESSAHPNNIKKGLSTIAAVSEKPRSKISPAQKQLALSEHGYMGNHSSCSSPSLAHHSSNVGSQLKPQRNQKLSHVCPTAITDTTILQSFGVLVPKENAPRRTDRKRNSKLSESSLKPLVDATFLPFSVGLPKRSNEMKVDRHVKKNVGKAFTPTDSLKTKPKNSCDKNCRTFRRSLSENNKTDRSPNLITNGVSYNLTTSNKIHSVRSINSSLSYGLSNQHIKTNEPSTVSADGQAKQEGIKSDKHDLCDLVVNDKISVNGCPISGSIEFQNSEIKHNGISELADTSQVEALHKVEFGCSTETSGAVNIEMGLGSTPNCNKKISKSESFLSEDKDKRLPSGNCIQSSVIFKENEMISADPVELCCGEILVIESNCPQPKTEFQSHQDNAHSALEAVCSESIACSPLSL